MGAAVVAVPFFLNKMKAIRLTPLQCAREYMGTHDIAGKKHNPLIVRWLKRLASWISDDETAWCSAFTSQMALDAGYERSNKLNARSWLDVGEAVPLPQAREGDIVVFWRVKKDSWQGHVAFFLRMEGEYIVHLGGNQSDSVSIARTHKSKLLGFRRLKQL